MIDDGLVVLFGLDETLCHGQVQLHAAPGYGLGYLDNEARQEIFEEVMLPPLRDRDFDTATQAAFSRIEEERPKADPALWIILARLFLSLRDAVVGTG